MAINYLNELAEQAADKFISADPVYTLPEVEDYVPKAYLIADASYEVVDDAGLNQRNWRQFYPLVTVVGKLAAAQIPNYHQIAQERLQMAKSIRVDQQG